MSTCTTVVEGEEGPGHSREEWREMDLSQWPEDHYYIHVAVFVALWIKLPLIKTLNKDP